ncbi:MAG: hypothetical protein ACE141_08085 [Bryobacteraceae bacterium]
MTPNTLKSIRKALANLNPADVHADAGRSVLVGLTASRGELFMAMESLLAPPDLLHWERVEALRHIYHTDCARGWQIAAVLYADLDRENR